jgi:hypothetical protein
MSPDHALQRTRPLRPGDSSRRPGDVLTAWKDPPGTKTRAVRGHEFGLDLPAEDRKALIAFLRTL